MSVKIRPFRSNMEWLATCEQARSDDHVLFSGSQAVLRDEVVIGAVMFMPTVFVWMDTRVCKVRDSAAMLGIVESHVAMNGAKMFNMPCRDVSPYFPLLEKAGFTKVSNHITHVKGV